MVNDVRIIVHLYPTFVTAYGLLTSYLQRY